MTNVVIFFFNTIISVTVMLEELCLIYGNFICSAILHRRKVIVISFSSSKLEVL